MNDPHQTPPCIGTPSHARDHHSPAINPEGQATIPDVGRHHIKVIDPFTISLHPSISQDQHTPNSAEDHVGDVEVSAQNGQAVRLMALGVTVAA